MLHSKAELSGCCSFSAALYASVSMASSTTSSSAIAGSVKFPEVNRSSPSAPAACYECWSAQCRSRTTTLHNRGENDGDLLHSGEREETGRQDAAFLGGVPRVFSVLAF